MSYCINPKCDPRYNQDHLKNCSVCHNPLLIQEKYRLLKPLRELDERANNEVFVVDAGGITKVLKVLQNPSLLPMFEREARILQRLDHPGIPHVKSDGYFTYTLNDGKKLHCLVMEKFAGQNLEQYLEKNGKINQDLAVNWLRQLTEILGMLHQNELFHRDIKLSNIMLKPDRQLALIDFGTAREMMSATYYAKVSDSYRYQTTGIVSPGYSPPEQINGKAVPQSDFYALGRCFVHLLTGVHPLDFREDEKTGQLIWYDSNKLLLDIWLVNLIDDLIAPCLGHRPKNTKQILESLEIQKDLPQLKASFFLRKPSLHELLRRNLGWLVALNILLFITLLVINGFLWWQARQPLAKEQSTNNSGITKSAGTN